MKELICMYSEENLSRITGKIILAYRKQNGAALYRLAREAGLNPDDFSGNRGKLFKRLMATFHPDRRVYFHSMIRRYHSEGNGPALERMRKNIALALTADPPQDPFAYGEEPVYRTDSTRINPEGDSWEEYLEDLPRREEVSEEWGFIEAVKNMMYGNLFSEFLPKDLAYLEGMLDLPDSEIEDLEGIEFCRNLTGLNLEGNRISRLNGLEKLPYLSVLYLARNRIEDIGPLASLTGLKTADLAYNDIGDISPLLNLPELEYVNLLGNPVENGELLEKLRERCLVIY